ncbi:hypothetical protein MBANPS3_002159 [Mucor bainieri]
MSDFTYKATFEATNKYLRYFCDKPASEWTLSAYLKHFREKDPKKVKENFFNQLQCVKSDSKNIPDAVYQYICGLQASTSEPAGSSSTSGPAGSSSTTNINVQGDYYRNINVFGHQRRKKKEKFT